MAFLEVGDQSRAGWLPPEQIARELCRGGAVDSPEAAQEADVLAGLLDLLATGDRARVQDAAGSFLAILEQKAPSKGAP